jgi:hypothetical protein
VTRPSVALVIAIAGVTALANVAGAWDYTYWGTLGLNAYDYADQARYVIGPNVLSGIDQYGNWYGGDPNGLAGVDQTPVQTYDYPAGGSWVGVGPDQKLLSPSDTNGGWQDTWLYTPLDLNGDGTVAAGEGDYDAASCQLTAAKFTDNVVTNGASWDVMMTEHSDFEHWAMGLRLPRDLEADGTQYYAGEILIARSTATIGGQTPILGAMLADFDPGDLYGHVVSEVDGSVPADHGSDWSGWLMEFSAYGILPGEEVDTVYAYTRMPEYQVTVGWQDIYTLPFFIPTPDGTPDDLNGDGTPDSPLLETVDRDFYQHNYDYDGDGTNESFLIDADGDGTLDVIRFVWGPSPKDVFPATTPWLDDSSRDADHLYVAGLSSIPEPGTIALVAFGCASLVSLVRRRRKQ